jgi:hypothetical protein
MMLMIGWMPCHVALPRRAYARYCAGWRVARHCSGFAAPWCQVTSHYCFPLHVTSRSAPYYRRPAASISCTHLMPAIHCIWHATYAFNTLPAPRAWWGHDESDVRCLGNAQARPGGRGPQGTWRLQSPPAPGGRSGATGHVVIPEPCGAVVLVPRSRGNGRAFPRRGRAWSRETRGDSGALSCRLTSSVSWGTWRHRSPLLAGGMLGASGHVAAPEPSPDGWCALCHGAHGRARALWHREWV